MEPIIIDTPLHLINLVILQPQRPGIWISQTSGEVRHYDHFSNLHECANYCAEIAQCLLNNGFFSHKEVFFRPEHLLLLDVRNTREIGPHIFLLFQDGRHYTFSYRDKASLENEHEYIAKPLARIQESRRNTHFTERPPP